MEQISESLKLRDGESITEFTVRRLRAEFLEDAALEIENDVAGRGASAGGLIEAVGRLRAMATR